MILGVHLWRRDAGASTIETSERKSHGAAVPEWLVLIEAATPDGPMLRATGCLHVI